MTRRIESSPLPPGVVLAEYYFDDELTVLFIVRADVEEPLLHIIDRPVSAVRQFVLAHFKGTAASDGSAVETTGDRVAELDEEAFSEFFAPFVEPLVLDSDEAPALVAPGETIWIVASDALFYVPLHAVRVNGQCVIDRNAVCYSPSASIMAHCRRQARGSRERALVIGDSLGDLDHAREEAASVARVFGTSAIVGAAATKQRLLDEIRGAAAAFDVLHFSCHAYFHPSDPLESGIFFAPPDDETTDGELLTAREIIGLDLNADLVALSGCDSGVNESLPGDELMGLTRALLFAGSSAILVSLWEVDDLSTGLLMNEFYRGLLGSPNQAPLDKARALQRAENAVRTMSAADVVAACDLRLHELGASHAGRAIRCRIDRAEMQAFANDRAAAIEAFEELEAILSRYTEDDGDALRARVSTALQQLRDMETADDRVDYQARPFEATYYWAPFVLVGDWR